MLEEWATLFKFTLGCGLGWVCSDFEEAELLLACDVEENDDLCISIFEADFPESWDLAKLPVGRRDLWLEVPVLAVECVLALAAAAAA